MSGYKVGYSEKHSPWWDEGRNDAERDARLVGGCPPLPPYGADPAKSHSAMYRRGYESVPQVPHQCTERCKK